MINRKKAFIFDLWNTLISKKGKRETELLADHFDLPANEIHEWIRISSIGKHGKDKYKVFESLCIENDLEFKESDKTFIDGLYDEYLSNTTWVDGAKECLIALRENGHRLGILSNTTELSYSVIKSVGLDQLVDEIVLSCDAGFLKPDPRIYHEMIRKLNVSIDQAVMVGDKITTDILGAMTVNMSTILYEPRMSGDRTRFRSSIDGIISNMFDVIKFI